MPEPTTITFDRERSTKNTHVYSERPDNGSTRIGQLYLQKTAAKALGDPETLTVTLTAGEGQP